MEGDVDCGGLLAYNYFSGEHITGFEAFMKRYAKGLSIERAAIENM